MTFMSRLWPSEITALLRALELALSRPLGASILLATSETDEEDAELTKRQRLLETDIEVNFTNTPLADALTWLSERLDEEIFIDFQSLTHEGIAIDTPVTLHDRGPARIVMRHLLEPLNLALFFFQ